SAGEDGEKDASGARGQSNTRRPHRTDAPTPPEYREAPTASDHIGKVLPAGSCLNVVVVPALTESQLSKSYDRDRQHSPRFGYCGLYQSTPLYSGLHRQQSTHAPTATVRMSPRGVQRSAAGCRHTCPSAQQYGDRIL